MQDKENSGEGGIAVHHIASPQAASEALAVNDRVKVRVLSVDIKKKRISLSMKTPPKKDQ